MSLITDADSPRPKDAGGASRPAPLGKAPVAGARRMSRLLDEALEDSFPASDPLSSLRIA